MSKAEDLVKLLRKLLKQEHLFDQEQLIQIKKQLRVLEEEMNRLKVSKGFGK
jgi:uncharacterized membrane protein (DUF106 family)